MVDKEQGPILRGCIRRKEKGIEEERKVRYRRMREGAIVKEAQRHQSVRQREVADPGRKVQERRMR